MQFVLFTDNLSDLDVPELCQAVKKAGFDGVDLTLRPGGHVKPADVEVGMAEARRYADAAGLTIPMVTTAITDVSSPQAEAVFAAAAHYGARHLKLGYWEYRPFGTVAKQLDDAQHKLERLVRLGRKYNVLPCIHCHSGAVLPNNGAFLYLLLRDFKPTEAGAYVDTMHMAIEGGLSGWEMGLDLIAPWIALVGVKNFRWRAAGRDGHGQQQFKVMYTPLADGQSPLPEFVARLKQLQYDGIFSLHSEYKGNESFRKLSTPELLEQSTSDLNYLKTLL